MSAEKDCEKRLRPYLSPAAVWALSVGTSIGWGSLFITGNTYLPTAGPLGSMIGMMIGAVIMIIISRNYHHLINKFPQSGGAYSYVKETFGYDHGFICSWFLVLTYIAMLWANATAIPLFAGYFMGDVFRFGFHYSIFGYEVYLGEALLSIVSILIIAFLCTKGRRIVSVLMISMIIIIIAGIMVCFAASLFSTDRTADYFGPAFIPEKSHFRQILRIACISPWAYIGFENISHSAEEFRFKKKRTFGILSVSVITTVILYVSIILLSVSAYPPEYSSWIEYIMDLENLSGIRGLPPFYAAYHYLGNTGIILLLLSMISLILTSLIGNFVSLSRLLYSMAKDEIIPKYFTALNNRHIPNRCIWLVAVLSVMIPFLGRSAIGWIVDVTTIGATIIYGFVSAAALKTARSNGSKAEFFTGITGLIFMIGFALYLLLFNLLSSDSMGSESYFLFTIWSVLGFVFFFNVLKRDNANKFGRSTVVWIALLLLILFTSLIWMSQSAMNSARLSMEEVRDHYSSSDMKDKAEKESGEEFMDNELQKLRSSNVKSMAVVIILFAVSLSIHILLQQKHKNLEREKMRVEEGSRAKSRFLFNMSHDIRTPMNAIVGFTHLARQEGITQDEKDQYLIKIENSGQQLLGIINDVLDMSRIENGKMELMPVAIDLRQILSEIKDLFSSQMESKKINYTLEAVNLEHPWIMCDKNRFFRIILNLVSNAYKFTGENGSVAVTITESGYNGDHADYELKVKDTGIGMSREFLKNMFNPFEMERSSTASGIQGTGLGLSITKGITEMMGGTIEVKSEPDKGTEMTVKLSFPTTEPAVDHTTEKRLTDVLDYSLFRLLLVEDNSINLEIAKMILSRTGFVVDTAENGKIALEKVEQSPPYTYDVILMDIQMPVMNGYDATREIRALSDKRLADIPIVAMTANVFQEDIQAAHNAGMDGHIAKPLDVKVMMQTLSDILIQAMKDGKISGNKK